MPPLTYCWTGSPATGLTALRGASQHQSCECQQLDGWIYIPQDIQHCPATIRGVTSGEDSCSSHNKQITKLLSWYIFNSRFMHKYDFFFHSQRTKRTKKNAGEIKLGLNKCYPHLQTATFLWESNLYTTFLCSIFFPKVLIMQKERDCDTFFPWMHSSESDHVHVVCNTHLQRGQMPALRGSMVCFTEVKCPCFSFLLALAVCRIVNGWQITHTDYIPCILVLSVPFSPFHLFFPQKFSFNSFDGGVP